MTAKITLLNGYLDLVKKVREIDPAAEAYLIFEAPRLKSFTLSRKLLGLFRWTDSRQGWNFWSDISNKLNKAR